MTLVASCHLDSNGSGVVKSADRALRVLLFLASRAHPAETRTIARELDLPKSSTYALLNAMQAHDFVTYHADRKSWGLGVVAYSLAGAYLRSRPLERLAAVSLQQLSDATGEESHLAEMYGTDILTLMVNHNLSIPGPRLTVGVGVRIPACLTASGRAMLMHRRPEQLEAMYPIWTPILGKTISGRLLTLAQLRSELRDAKQAGFAVNNELNIPGIHSIAAPVFGGDSLPVAAVGITILAGSRSVEENEVLGRLVCRAAADLSAALAERSDEVRG
jgi:DNA-binding IclR family transcriptional regulator